MKIQEKKKNYNPFKMWGSWVGGVVFFLLEYFSRFIPFTMDSSNFVKFIFYPRVLLSEIVMSITNIIYPCNETGPLACLFHNSGINIYSELTLIVILGFITGWLIHSLFRSKKNKK